jgi:hypothetical protein
MTAPRSAALRNPARPKPIVPRRVADARGRAREAASVLVVLQRDTKWHPASSQMLAWDFQQARAILSKAEATYEAWRRGLSWAVLDEIAPQYDRFAGFVNALRDRGQWRPRTHRKRTAAR